MKKRVRSHLCGRTLKLQQHHGAGTLHDVEVEQQWLLPVTTYSSYKMVKGRTLTEEVHVKSAFMKHKGHLSTCEYGKGHVDIRRFICNTFNGTVSSSLLP